MFEYNLNYWDKMIRQNSPTAKEINKIRWNFIKPVKPKSVLDYGSGCGFFRAFRPVGIECDTFDINNYPQSGINKEKYDLVCFWDVIEHFKDLNEIFTVLEKVKAFNIAFTVPALQIDTVLELWKHYKPGEHFHYFSDDKWDNLFLEHGYKKIRSGYPECPPRSDIYSAIFKRKT